MKRIAFLFLLFLPSLSLQAQNNDDAFRLRAAHIYADTMALLEYRGQVNGIRFDLPLPEGTVEEGIVVRTQSNDRLLNYTVQEVTAETKRPVRTKLEFLKENVGYSVAVEVFEGRESVAYSGEIQAIDEQAELLFLKTNNSLESIPIANIQHFSGGRGLNMSVKQNSSTRQLSVFFVGDVSKEVLTVLLPNKQIMAEANYLLDFDKSKTELSLDIRLNSAVSLNNISVFYYGVPFKQQDASAYSAQAAFQLSGVTVPARQQISYQVMAHNVELSLSDVAEIGAWEPGNSALSQSGRGVRTLAIQNSSPMNWFHAAIYERKSRSLGRLPSEMPNATKGNEAKLVYGLSPYVINDNARLVKVTKKAETISGMKYDSYLFEGKIDIRNTGNEAGRVKIIKQAVPENKRNYWFANVFTDLKGKNKQEIIRLEYEVKVEANDATFYRYKYELLVPSNN